MFRRSTYAKASVGKSDVRTINLRQGFGRQVGLSESLSVRISDCQNIYNKTHFAQSKPRYSCITSSVFRRLLVEGKKSNSLNRISVLMR
jgi:hypothetical protein